MHNLLLDGTPAHLHINGIPVEKLVARLDTLLFVLKSCKGEVCRDPWAALHPLGNVQSLQEALSPRFDQFYQQDQQRVRFDRCEMGYIVESEGPQFETDGLVFRHGASWDNWT